MAKKSIHIVIVDDNETDIKITTKLLESLGHPYTLEVFHDGREALDHFGAPGVNAPDLILLDVLMPYMDGYAFIQEVKAVLTLRGVPIIVFTSQEYMADIFRVEGVADYMVKSFYSAELIPKIKKCLGL